MIPNKQTKKQKPKPKKERKKQAEIYFNIQYTPHQIVNGEDRKSMYLSIGTKDVV